MPSSNQFTALGPAIVGFQTNGANIQNGAVVAGTELGLQGTGPTGVFGQGQGGPGGRFASTGDPPGPPQINLEPHDTVNPGATEPAKPTQFAKPETILPPIGAMGDMWCTNVPHVPNSVTLWICVNSSAGTPGSAGFKPAMWSQVLLGSPVEGMFPVSNL